MKTTYEVINETCKSNMDRAQRALDKFAENFKANACYAFEWSESAFTAAADNEMNARIIAYAETAQKDMMSVARFLDSCRDSFMKQALREIESPSRSTSVQSNMIKQALATAAYKLALELDSLRGKI